MPVAKKITSKKIREIEDTASDDYEVENDSSTKTGSNKIVYVLIALLVIGAFFIGSLWTKVKLLEGGTLGKGGGGPVATVAPGQGAPAAANVNIKDVKITGEPTVGKDNAPVTMAYWRDFQCPFCQRFEQQTLAELYTKYIATGKLRVVFKDFQFLGADSQTLGLVGRAVWEVAPEKYYNWQKYIFDHMGAENSGWGTKDKAIVLTKAVLGTDVANKVSALVTQKTAEYQKAIDEDKAEGAKFGINGTPGFVIGTQTISGAMPIANFESAIDALLTGK